MGYVSSWRFVVFTCLLSLLTCLSQGVWVAIAALSYSGATFDKTTRTFRWTPLAAQVGRHGVTFSVSDGKATDLEGVVVTVN